MSEQPEGFTAMDLLDLPAAQGRLMRLVMRRSHLTYGELCKAIAALPLSDRLSDAELDQALEALSARRWLVSSGEGDECTYRANLRRRGSGPQRVSPSYLIEDE